jgi:hypothetical protein
MEDMEITVPMYVELKGQRHDFYHLRPFIGIANGDECFSFSLTPARISKKQQYVAL